MRRDYTTLEPDEIFLDSENLPDFDQAHMEGRIERPLSSRAIHGFMGVGALVLVLFFAQAINLMVFQYDAYAQRAENNRLEHAPLIAERGVIVDRDGNALAKNVTDEEGAITRVYPLGEAAAQVVGYVSYPKKDEKGVWYQSETQGLAGVEKLMNESLAGQNGVSIQETDVHGEHVSGSVVRDARPGSEVQLTIDSDLQEAMYRALKKRVDASFVGGAGAITDVNTGELLALASYPSYNPEVMSSGIPAETVRAYIADKRSPFLDRAVSGLYTPGSIMKPFIASAALAEGVVSPEKTFVSTGRLVLPNPYNPDKPSIFKDWKAHGAVDMRRALAVSSDVYFYIVGGGFESQKGLGITAIDKYAAKFGFGEFTGFPDDSEPAGTVPSPEWKAETFDGDEWRVGDTYITSIGQYGWQVTLLQALRATAAIANGGVLHVPRLIKSVPPASTNVGIADSQLKVVREGMRQAVESGTAQALAQPSVRVAGKTGTAEVGAYKEKVNSLVIGFFPYDHPRYAFAVILEHAKAGTALGAPAAMQEVLGWIAKERPDLYEVVHN